MSKLKIWWRQLWCDHDWIYSSGYHPVVYHSKRCVDCGKVIAWRAYP